MKFAGMQALPASPTRVWTALIDPAVLQACIPGCERLAAVEANAFETVIVASIGPVRARLDGTLSLADVVVNASYTLHFDLRAAANGFGRGAVRVRLEQQGDGCALQYEADAQIGGRIAQLGSRLIEGTAKKIADAFFARFAEQLVRSIEPAADPVPAPAMTQLPPPRPSFVGPWLAWSAGVVLLAVVIWSLL
ncbi:MAG: carbon monoxide dehydrogenase subunit G [Gammaproteobacteria bacterium]